jgi:CTP:molybdopterin cytidylyltransferase MocA
MELRGDRGAGVLFHRNPTRVVRVPMDSAALDIDTPEDLLRLDPNKR